MLAAAAPAAAAAALAATSTRLLARAGRLMHAADAAADTDPELDSLRRNGHRMRLADMQRVAKAFDQAGFLRPGLSAALAADILWAIASPDAYRAFTVHRRWTAARFERWLAESIQQTLFTH